MNWDSTFAVVDLETTGNSIQNNDRIIQFGCTIISHQRIIKNFSVNVNAQIPIPERITQLTGISENNVKNAPTWSEIADQVIDLLQGTIFVAHNVNFDFPFLNHELKRIGKAPLTIKAVDTVTLSQILLPSLPSYRLRDLTQYFNIDHKHPHAAISDAHATAQLFLMLLKRLMQMPIRTLINILQLKIKLPQDTLQLFKSTLTYQRKQNFKLPNYLIEVGGLVLRRSNSTKGNLISKKITYSPTLQWVWNNFDQPFKQQSALVIEQPATFKQELAWVAVMANLAQTHHQQLMLSVDNQASAQTLLTQVLPLLDTDDTFQFAKFRPLTDLLDLKRFKIMLAEPIQSNQFQLLKARILVWLMSTTSGDLTELSINNQQYLDEIRYLNVPQLDKTDVFYSENYAHRQYHDRKTADCIVTMHHHLYQHQRTTKQPYLLIHQPLSLPKIALRQSLQKIVIKQLNLLIRRLKSHLVDSHRLSLDDLINDKIIKRLMNQLATMDTDVKLIQHDFAQQFLGKANLNATEDGYQTNLTSNEMLQFIKNHQMVFQEIKQAFHKINQISTTHIMAFISKFTIQQQSLFNYYWTQLTLLRHEINHYTQLKQLIMSNSDNVRMQIQVRQPHDINNAVLIGGIQHLQQRLKNRIYRFFQPPVFLSTINSTSAEAQQLLTQLNLSKHRTLIKRFLKPRQQVVLPTVNLSAFDNDRFNQWSLRLIAHHHLKMLVVVNSYAMIDHLYYQWAELGITNQFNVLAQAINANKHKLHKNIMNDHEIIAIIDTQMLDQYPELMKKSQAVLFWGDYHLLSNQLWIKQILTEAQQKSFIGLLNTSLSTQPHSVLTGLTENWYLQSMNIDHFIIRFNKFWQNYQKNRAFR